MTSLWLFIFEKWCKCTSKSNKQKIIFSFILKVTDEIPGSGRESGTDPWIRIFTKMSRIRNTDRNWCNLPLPPLIAPPAELKYGFSGRRETLQKEQNFLRQVPGTIHKLLGRKVVRIARIYANLSLFSTTIPQHKVHKITRTTSSKR